MAMLATDAMVLLYDLHVRGLVSRLVCLSRAQRVIMDEMIPHLGKATLEGLGDLD
jgi:hypothetical protein